MHLEKESCVQHEESLLFVLWADGSVPARDHFVVVLILILCSRVDWLIFGVEVVIVLNCLLTCINGGIGVFFLLFCISFWVEEL